MPAVDYRIVLRRYVVAATALATCVGLLAGARAARPAAGADLSAGPKPPAPYFHSLWKEEITEPVHRVAVADTVGDGKPRLILLIEKPLQKGLAVLKVKKWDGTQFVTEFTGNVDANADGLEVGKFAGKDKPAQIVTADALWQWDGKTYIRKPARKELALFGTARMKSGEDRIILAETATQFKSYQVNADATGTDWLTDRTESPSALDVEWEAMHSTPDFFRKMGMPSFLCAGGFITVWDANHASVPYLYYCRFTGDAASAVKSSFLGMRDATEAGGIELWTSPRLVGQAIDVALQDPRASNRAGILVLTNGSATAGKLATIQYFSKD